MCIALLLGLLVVLPAGAWAQVEGTAESRQTTAEPARNMADYSALFRRPARFRMVHRQLGLWLAGTERDGVGYPAARQGSVGLRMQQQTQAVIGWLSLRARGAAWMGFGGAGADGGIDTDLAVGVRAPLTRAHGPILRVGLRGQLAGNRSFHSNRLELPSVQLGYEWLARGVMVEVFGRLGYTLSGRLRIEDESRRLNNRPRAGVVASTGVGPVTVALHYDELWGASEGPLREVHGAMCVALRPWVVCAQGRRWSGALRVNASGERAAAAHVLYGGVQLGLGY